jgi:hypothetical protein
VLTFDDVKHQYRWDGVVVPGVTGLLQTIHSFAGVPGHILEPAQERGTYVHAMTEMFDLGELDEEANALVAGGLYVGYLKAWKAFCVEYEPNWTEIEQMGYSRLGYAGTWDRVGTLARKWPGNWLVDIKTSAQHHRAWGVQTAAYRQIRAERDMRAALDNRATVQLRADGTFNFIAWTDPHDLPCFQALLTIHNWSKKP